MKYTVKFTGQFKKDYKLAVKQNKNIEKLVDVIETLAEGKTLDESYRDHLLIGKYKGNHECHIEPDWLMIYEYIGETLLLERLGSHSELFK